MNRYIKIKPAMMAFGLANVILLPAFGQDEEEIYTLSPFAVEATQGYAATNTISGTALNTPLKNVPMSINVITSQFLEDSHIGDFSEALDYNSSITQTNRQPISNNGAIFSIRGFRNRNNLVDGVLGSDFVPTFMIDRIEVVKGPNTLYGQSDPGGLVNTISKRPKAKDETILSVKAGNHGWFEAEADVNFRGGKDDKLGFRFLASHKEQDGWRPIGAMEEKFFAGIAEYNFTENTTGVFTLAGSDKSGVPTNRATWSFEDIATDLNGDGDTLDKVDGVTEANARYNNTFIPNNYTTATSTNRYEQSNTYLTAGLRHAINKDSNIQYLYKFHDSELYGTFREFNTFGTNGTSAGVYNNDSDMDRNEVHTLNYNTSIELGETRHEVLFGIRRADSRGGTRGSYRLRSNNAAEALILDDIEARTGKTLRRVLTKQDILNGVPIWNDDALTFEENRSFGLRTNQFDHNEGEITTMYLTDNIFMMEDKLNVLLGVRSVDLKSESFNLGNISAGNALKADDVSFQLGAVYDVNKSIALYTNLAEAFEPNGNVNADTGLPYGPETSEAWEVGFKFSDLFNGKLNGSFSYFNISKDNVVRSDFNPVTSSNDVVVTSDNSQGYELELFAAPTSFWDVVLGFSLIDGRVVGALSPELEGLRLEGATPKRLTFFNSFHFDEGPLKGLRLGGGLVWADGPIQQFGTPNNRLVVEDGYTQIDLFARYTTTVMDREMTFGVNIDNASDQYYVRSRAAVNDARQVVFSVSTKL